MMMVLIITIGLYKNEIITGAQNNQVLNSNGYRTIIKTEHNSHTGPRQYATVNMDAIAIPIRCLARFTSFLPL